MKTKVHEFDSYKDFLKEWTANSLEKNGRGAKSELARAANCQLAYISQVLNRHAHLNLEQLDGIANHLELDAGEKEFLFLLLHFERASTSSLRQHLKSQIKRAREAHLSLKNRVHVSNTLTDSDKSTYYSSWHYSAIHVLTGIPIFQTAESIAKRLRLPRRRVFAVLDFLSSCGLIQRKDGRYKRTEARIHLPGDSPLISRHHANARLLATASAEFMNEENLQYSSIVTISNEDALRIKALLIDSIDKAKKITKSSQDETIYCFNLDFFELFPSERGT